MEATRYQQYTAVLQALLVTFLWSTSWIFIKIGLADIPALTFAGLRYSLAFLVLLPLLWHDHRLERLRRLPPRLWFQLVLLGLLFYTLTQGAQFASLFYLPATTTSLLLSFTSVLVAISGIALLGERPSRLQWGGISVYLLGAWLFFYPIALPVNQILGLIIALVGVVANALATIQGRAINRIQSLDPTSVTLVSMGMGGTCLLAVGLATQGLPRLSATNWGIIIWLAVINSALAFTLWNQALRSLTAVKASLINNTMLFQIAILAWIFLGEALSGQKITGILLAALGTLLVQLRPQKV